MGINLFENFKLFYFVYDFFLSIDIFRNSIDLIVQNLNKAIACLEAGECEKELTQEQYKIRKYLVRTILNSFILVND